MIFSKNGKPIALLLGQNWLFSGTFELFLNEEKVENGRFLAKMASL